MTRKVNGDRPKQRRGLPRASGDEHFRSSDRSPTVRASSPWLLRQPWVPKAVHLGLILLLVVIAYSDSFSVGWHYDDEHVIQKNKTIRDLGEAFLHIGSSTRSLAQFTFAVNYAFSRLDPWGYHLVNIIIHALAAVFLYAWLCTVLPEKYRGAAIASAALFAVHPLATQSVTYVTQRFSSMAGMFFFAALWSWALYRTYGSWRHLVAALLAAVAAMLCKEMSAVIPLALIVADFTIHNANRTHQLNPTAAGSRPLPDNTPRARSLRPIHAVLLAMMLIVPVLDRVVRSDQSDDGGEILNWAAGTNISRATYFLSQAQIIVRTYLRLALVPLGLSIEHPFAVVQSVAHPEMIVTGLVLLALLGFGAWIGSRSLQPLFGVAGFGILLFFFGLAVTSTFVPNTEFVQEQRTYVSLAGIIVAVCCMVASIPRARILQTAAACAAIAVLAGLTYQRNKVWQSRLSLWEDCVAKRPNSARAYSNYGQALAAVGRNAEAIERYRYALELNPSYHLAHNNLGNALVRQGKFEEAMKHFQAALQLKPDYAPGHNNLGMALARQGEFAEAQPRFEKAIALDPDYSAAHSNLGNILAEQGRHAEAIEHYNRALSLETEFPEEVHNNLAGSLLDTGNLDAALAHYREAVRLRPQYAEAYCNMSVVLDRMGRRAEAISALEAALRVDPRNVTTAARKAQLEATLRKQSP